MKNYLHTPARILAVFKNGISEFSNSEYRRLRVAVAPYTLVGPERSGSLYRLAKRIESDGTPGDIVECGVRNGGTAAVLAHSGTHSRFQRTLWLFDSFEGMPETTREDGEAAAAYIGKEVGSIQNVYKVLGAVGADCSRVRIVVGLFHNTFPTVDIPRIALLNIDCDWYESVKASLEKFYDAVVTGGFINLDDYGHWPGCRQAVEEFFQSRGLRYKLNEVDYTARWFQKR